MNQMKNAFSIVELVLVITVMSILIAFMVPKASSILDTAKNIAVKSIVKSLQIDLETSFLNSGYYPNGTHLSISSLVNALNTVGISVSLPKNPFTGKSYSDNDLSGKIIYSYTGLGYVLKGFGKDNKTELISVGN